MPEKKSFLLYIDRKEQISKLTNEQGGILLKAIFEYADTGNEIITDDIAVDLVFSIIKSQIDEDGRKWEEKRQKRSEAGKKSGESRRNKNKQNQTKQTSVDFVEQRGTKRTVTDTVTVTDTDTVVSVSEDTDTIEQARTAPEGAAQPAYKREPHEYDPNEPYYKIVPIEEFGDDLV